MDNIQEKFEQIETRLGELNENINGLQDLMLYLKSNLETIMHREEEKSYITRLTLNTNKHVSKFLKERSTDCKFWDFCTRRVEKATTLILHAFMEEGSSTAITEADFHINSVMKYREEDCANQTSCNEECFKNIVETFETMKNLLQTFEKSFKSSPRDLEFLSKTKTFEQGSITEICEMIKPLSNESRLRVLKELGKGSKNYATIERRLGIKGGHLQFHLNILLKAKYITKDKTYGNYQITRHGLKALRLSFELSESI